MGLFNGLFGGNEKAKTKIEEYADYLRKNGLTKEEEYIRKIINGSILNPFITEENLMLFMNFYMEGKDDYLDDFEETINTVKELFDQIYISTSDFTNFEIFLNGFKKGGFFINELFNKTLYNLFDNEKYYYLLMETLNKKDKSYSENYKMIDFFIDARSYFISEDTYVASMFAFLSGLVYGIDVEMYINKSIADIRKRIGIYDISEERLELIHEKVMSSSGYLTELEESIKRAEKIKESLKTRVENYRSDIINVNKIALEKYNKELKKDLEELTDLAEKIKTELESFSISKLEELRKELVSEEASAIESIKKERDRMIEDLKIVEQTLSQIAESQGSEISRLGSVQLEKLDEYLKNDPELIEKLKSSKIEFSEEQMKVMASLAAKSVVAPAPVVVSGNAETQPVGVIGTPTTLISPSNIIVSSKRIIDYKINPYFDKKRSFESRIKEIEEKMDKNVKEKGIIYHEETIEVVKAVIEGLNPYLYGPSGGGKSITAIQVGELLGLSTLTLGYINEEYQVVGAEPFLGNYKRSGMQECFEEGKLAFIDEFDNGNQRATVIVNPFLRKSTKYYTFANNEQVLRHPNFRIIAAANTDGKGGTRSHITREKIEESVRQRFHPFFIGYDTRVEKSLIKDYPEWYNFILAFRKAQRDWDGNDGELTLEDAITTADIETINELLTDNVYTINKLISLQFVQSKSKEYLEAIKRYLNDQYTPSSEQESEILKVFQDEVDKYYLKRGL